MVQLIKKIAVTRVVYKLEAVSCHLFHQLLKSGRAAQPGRNMSGPPVEDGQAHVVARVEASKSQPSRTLHENHNSEHDHTVLRL